jgi:DNA-binding Lrp family transcriptional regulator
MEGTKGAIMSVSAYILIQTEIGRASDVVHATRAVPGVVESEEITGPYDVIVRCGAENLDELGRFVISAIQQIGGISRTLTCPVVAV